MSNWLEDARALRRAGRPAALVTVTAVRGSAPREPGTRMLVTADEAIGTIGGGQLEYRSTELAARLLQEPAGRTALLRRFPLGADCGQCCGGVVDVLVEPLAAAGDWLDALGRHADAGRPAALLTQIGADGATGHAVVAADAVLTAGFEPDHAMLALARAALADRRVRQTETPSGAVLIEPLADTDFVIAVFGAGHVGAATVRVLATLDARIRWIDTRPAVLPASTPRNVLPLATDSPAREVAALPPGACYLVMTHSHPLDLEICERVLARGDFAYLGLIGSRAKRRRFEQRLRAAGHRDLGRLNCPIGAAGTGGKAPAEIAIAAAAELLAVRSARAAARAAAPPVLRPLPGGMA